MKKSLKFQIEEENTEFEFQTDGSNTLFIFASSDNKPANVIDLKRDDVIDLLQFLDGYIEVLDRPATQLR